MNRKFVKSFLHLFFSTSKKSRNESAQDFTEDLYLMTRSGHRRDLSLVASVWYQLLSKCNA